MPKVRSFLVRVDISQPTGVILERAERWESQRFCLGKWPMWDVDANKGDAQKAAQHCVNDCPVIEMCHEQQLKDRREGLYAGYMWDKLGRKFTLEDFYKTHRSGVAVKKPRPKAGPGGFTEERNCVECAATFTVTARNQGKLYCNEECARQARRKADSKRKRGNRNKRQGTA